MSGEPNAIRSLLLFDRHEFTRVFLGELLEKASGDIHVRTVCSLDQLGGSSYNCDLILINIQDGRIRDQWVRADLHRVAARFPAVPVAVLSVIGEPDAACEALRSGISGYLMPTLDARHLVAALYLIMAGGICITRTADWTGHLDDARPRADRGWMARPSLTPRESEVLDQLKQGKPNKLIAYELGMSENTVKVHVNRIMKKMGATNRTTLAFMGSEIEDTAPAGLVGPAPQPLAFALQGTSPDTRTIITPATKVATGWATEAHGDGA